MISGLILPDIASIIKGIGESFSYDPNKAFNIQQVCILKKIYQHLIGSLSDLQVEIEYSTLRMKPT